MTDNDNPSQASDTSPHKGARVSRTFKLANGDVEAQVIADWLDIYEKDEPKARMFHTAYLASDPEPGRPIVFLVNGGPGASSVFLQFACAGPKAVARNADGRFDTADRTLTTEPSSWLGFADLVFIDPIGTGFSHLIPSSSKEGDDKKKSEDDDKNPYWTVQKDLDALGQFMRRFLREHTLWTRPLYFAGESYGGYRACRMARLLNNAYGLGMTGIISISPIWQFRDASDSELSTSQWVNLLPTYAAIAHHHGIGRYFSSDTPMDEALTEAERFSLEDYAPLLVSGTLMTDEKRQGLLSQVADLIGLSEDVVRKAGGRIPIHDYGRMVRKEHGEIIDLYDGSQSTLDPFPHRTNNELAIERSLFPDMHVFQTALNQWYFEDLGVETPLEYTILNMEAFKNWKNDEKQFDLFELTASVDDFRAGMTLNTSMRTMIVHGRYDMVTPYFASKRILNQSNLVDSVKDRISERLYKGGHMFYSWPDVNAEFAKDVQSFIE